MSHCRVLFVGTIENLFNIFEECPDLLCESPSEIAFSYDYLTVYTKKELLENLPHHPESLYPEQEECEFTKDDMELYDKIVSKRQYYECYDIRDETPEHNLKWEFEAESDIKTYFENLPNNTHFFVCDGHL